MNDDYELSDYQCPKCGEHLMQRDCEYCIDGIIDDLHEQDPLWYDEDDWEYCSNCNGKGVFIWCDNPECDVTDKEINQHIEKISQEWELEDI